MINHLRSIAMFRVKVGDLTGLRGARRLFKVVSSVIRGRINDSDGFIFSQKN